jgi:signal transduction histidine kinase/ActR/RegA family two-component response regulator
MRMTSIRQKVMRVVMTTTLVALLTSAAALLLYELRTYRATWVEDLSTQADLIAKASAAALAFDDPRVARENLAMLRLRPQIEAAAIYRADARLFAQYTAAEQKPIEPRLSEYREGPNFEGDELELRQRIEQNGELLGTMVLRARYDVAPRLRDYLAILLTVTLASLGFAGLIGRRLQRSVTDPIVAVADVAREVVQQRNYALRADKTTADEVGELVDAFNDMLRELGGQAAALQLADRRKDEFLATLAHELRNPLAPLGNALAILDRDDSSAPLRRQTREMMHRQLRQLVRLIDDLLDVSRISTGRLELRMETVDLVEIVQSAVESVLPELEERGHRLTVAWPLPVWVRGDRTRLGQVFVNLLNNAAKYTDRGGRIQIAFAVDPGTVEVRVADNGMGIDPSMQAAVFEMFMQVDKSLERGRAGLGVGLALTRQLVELHGGSVTLRSAGLGHGTTFAVRLARSVAAAPAPEPPVADEEPRAPAPTVRRLRVLVADDNVDFAESLAGVLESSGHVVQVVHDGRAGLEAALAQAPDVGLFDIGMPGMNGYDLARAVRTRYGTTRPLLVALTGWGQESDQDRARTAGFDRHFVKPVDLSALLALLSDYEPPARSEPIAAG